MLTEVVDDTYLEAKCPLPNGLRLEYVTETSWHFCKLLDSYYLLMLERLFAVYRNMNPLDGLLCAPNACWAMPLHANCLVSPLVYWGSNGGRHVSIDHLPVNFCNKSKEETVYKITFWSNDLFTKKCETLSRIMQWKNSGLLVVLH